MLDRPAAASRNFNGYDPIRISEAPPIEVPLMRSKEHPGGVFLVDGGDATELPGRAWLQFLLTPDAKSRTRLSGWAWFEPRGLAGDIYWWLLYAISLLDLSGHGESHTNEIRGHFSVLSARLPRELCPTCSAVMTLRIDASGTVTTAPCPASVHDEHADVVPISVGQSGLLPAVNSPLREHKGHGIDSRGKAVRHAG